MAASALTDSRTWHMQTTLLTNKRDDQVSTKAAHSEQTKQWEWTCGAQNPYLSKQGTKEPTFGEGGEDPSLIVCLLPPPSTLSSQSPVATQPQTGIFGIQGFARIASPLCFCCTKCTPPALQQDIRLAVVSTRQGRVAPGGHPINQHLFLLFGQVSFWWVMHGLEDETNTKAAIRSKPLDESQNEPQSLSNEIWVG